MELPKILALSVVEPVISLNPILVSSSAILGFSSV
jgi:hypothetical protein